MAIEVYFASNRDVTGTDDAPVFGTRFNAMGPQFFRVGWASISRAENEGLKVDSMRLAPEKLREGQEDAVEILGSTQVFHDLQAKLKSEGRDVIIFLHGFANTLENCLIRGAQLKERYLIKGRQAEVFVFSWPSDGKTFPATAYHDDRSDAAASGDAMARALAKLLDFIRAGEERCACGIHLVAHSMGNWALRHAVQGIRRFYGTDLLPQIFENTFLMAADEDDNTLEHDHKMRLITRLSRAVHVYHSKDDQALLISETTKNNPDRLGSRGPRLVEGLDTKVFMVDCQHVDETTPEDAGHQYYRERQEVINDVRQVLSGVPADEITNRRPTGTPRSFRIKPARG